MLQKVLVPLDGSELSDRIVTQLRRLLVGADATVQLVQVVPDRAAHDPAKGPALIDAAREHLDRIAAPLRASGANVTTEVLLGEPAERIVRFACDTKPSLIAMATHGRSGVARWIRGSTAERVLRSSPFPLFLANPHGVGERHEMRIRRILVPLDGSERSAEVLPLVNEIARRYESEVEIFYAIEVPMGGEPFVAMPIMTSAEARELLEPFRRRLEAPNAQVRSALGPAAVSILEEAERGKFDLIALGTHGRGGVDRWVFGSVAENVVRHAPCPLLVLRTGPPSGSAALTQSQ